MTNITKEQADVIGEVANICTGNAATTLSMILNHSTNITTPRVEVLAEEASLTSFDGTEVASSEALEQALSTDAAKICITADFELDQFRGSFFLGAVDLSATTDLSSAKALVMLPNDSTKFIISHYWIPQTKLELSPDKDAGAQYEEWARQGILTINEDNEIDDDFGEFEEEEE